MNQFNDAVVAQIRTTVPAVVGVLLAYLAAHFNIVIDENAANGLILFVGALLTAVYYLIAQIAERKVGPWFGILLGFARTPVYQQEETKVVVGTKPSDTQVIVVPDPKDPETPNEWYVEDKGAVNLGILGTVVVVLLLLWIF